MQEKRNKNIFVRVNEKEKNRIESYAKKCGLSVSEYLRQLALVYQPKAALSEIFYDFNSRLDALLEAVSSENEPLEQQLLSLMDDIYRVLLDPNKEYLRGPRKACFVGKRKNHISDHYKLREISDEVCRNRGKSVLENSSFYGRSKGERRAQMSGVPTHREMLKRDVERCLSVSSIPKDFEQSLKDLGYIFTKEGKTLSVKAPDWKRSVRLSSLGYPTDNINERMKINYEKRISYFYVKRRNFTPLLSFEAEMKKAGRMSGVQLTFALVIELCKLISGGNIALYPQTIIDYRSSGGQESEQNHETILILVTAFRFYLPPGQGV